jgi:Cu2+-exporting ATPase
MNTVTDAGPVYFDGVAMLVFLLLCGRYLQLRGQRYAADASELLFSITPSTARIVGPDGRSVKRRRKDWCPVT